MAKKNETEQLPVKAEAKKPQEQPKRSNLPYMEPKKQDWAQPFPNPWPARH